LSSCRCVKDAAAPTTGQRGDSENAINSGC